MALLALLAHRALVLVVLLVATVAVERGLAMLLLGQVALLALDLLVLVLQLEVGQVMVEFLFVQRDDVRLAPLVFGVADRARLPLHLSVIALFFGQIAADVLVRVAFDAQVVLVLLAEMRVAVLAIGFGFGVFLD